LLNTALSMEQVLSAYFNLAKSFATPLLYLKGC